MVVRADVHAAERMGVLAVLLGFVALVLRLNKNCFVVVLHSIVVMFSKAR